MAFDTLGVNVVANGIRGVAGDIGHLALSFLRYVRAVQQADAASVKAAASQSKLATAMAGKSQTSVDRLEKQYIRLKMRADSLKTSIDILYMTMRNPLTAQLNYNKSILDMERQKTVVEQLNLAYQQLVRTGQTTVANAFKAKHMAKEEAELKRLIAVYNKMQKEYIESLKEQNQLNQSTQNLATTTSDMAETAEQIVDAYNRMQQAQEDAADKQQAWADAVDAASSQTGMFGRLLSDLTGSFGAATAGNSAFMSGLGLTIPQLGAVMVAMDVLKVGLRIAQAAFNAFAAVVRVVWNVLKKLVGIVWDVAKAIGKTLWNALIKVVSAPFKLISSLFGNMGGSMQRVLEMAIGMNLSRVWWQLGMKIRDSLKVATDAAIEFQVTYTRLSTLMKNEVIGKLGPSSSMEDYNKGLEQAAVQTKELITWTSKLAVLTIFGAEDILSVYTLAMSYGFASTQAEKLTESVLDFASGMGLGDTEMKRVIENFGQMRAQGKITGTELRDLARGSFVPVNDVLEQMAKNVGLVGDYDVPNLQAINDVLKDMADNGEITNDTFTTMSGLLAKLGADGKITRQEFDTLVQDLSQNDIMQKFGLSAEQAGKALEGIKTGKLTQELNELIKTGKITIDEFFDAFIEMVTNKYPNAARSMGLTMKAVKSNIEDYIATMVGWRLIAPVFEVVAKHVQNFIQNTMMTEAQIERFDQMGKALKTVTELYMTYYDALLKAGGIFSKLAAGPFSQISKVFMELVKVIGTLGTADFSIKKLENFSFLLKAFGMTAGSRKVVSTGIESLNKIMKDIIDGVEIDPTKLKKALDDVFGTMWKDFFGPKIKDGIESAWKNVIAPAIGKLWTRMKEKFSEWKTDTLIPGIKTFFGETLPRWISSFGTWIKEEGPKIILDIGKFVSDILIEFVKITSFHFGEDNPITRLIVALKELVTYGAFKIADPTSSINATNVQNLATAFSNLGTSIKNAFFDTSVGQMLLGWINEPAFARVATYLVIISGLIGDIANSISVLTGSIFNVANPFDSMTEFLLSNITKLTANISDFVGWILIAKGAIYTLIDPLLALAAGFKNVNFKDLGTGEVLDLKKFFDNFSEGFKSYDPQGPAALEAGARAINNSAAVLNGIDAYGAVKKVDNLIGGINSWAQMSPLAPLNFDQVFNITGTANYNLPPRFDYNPDTGDIQYHPPEGGVVTTKTEVDQMLSVTATLLNQPGFIYDETTGNIVYTGTTTLQSPKETINKLVAITMNVETDDPNWTYDEKTGMVVFSGTNNNKPSSQFDWEIQQSVKIMVDNLGFFLGGTPSGKTKKELVDSLFGGGEEAVKLDIPVETGFQEIITNAATAFKNDTTIQASASAMALRAGTAINTENANTTADFQTFTDGLSTIMETAAGPFTAAGTNAVAGLRGGMESEFEALLVWWIKQVAKLNAIVPTMNMQHSPSRLYRGYGEDMMKGLQLGLESGQEGAVSQMHDAAIELRQALGAINTGTISPQQYNNVSNTTNWNVNVTTPLVASTPIQAYEILRMRAR